MEKPESLYHLLLPNEWIANTDYSPSSLATEGFIHLSTKSQLLASAKRFFGEADIVLVVEVAPEKLQAELLYERADGQHFPHLYGILNRDAVVSVTPMPRDNDGHFVAPWDA